MGEHHASAGGLGQRLGPEPAAGQGTRLEPLALAGRHAAIGFHQHQLTAGRKLGPALGQGLGQLQGQLPFARARFDQGQGPRTCFGSLLGPSGLLKIQPHLDRQFRQPPSQLGGEQGGEVRAQGGGGDEIAAAANLQPATAIGPVLGIMQGPAHVGAKRHRAPRR